MAEEEQGCQCYTCRHKGDYKVLEAYYHGNYDAYKEAVRLVEQLQELKTVDKGALLSALSKLNYELDCAGAFLEEAEATNKEHDA